MTKKHKYAIEINEFTDSQDCKKYYYSYGNTKDICIALTENSIRVSCEMTVEYDPQRFQNREILLFSDAIRKSLLVYLIIFSKNIEVITRQASLFIDNVYQSDIPVTIHSLIPDMHIQDFPTAWSSEKVIENILTYTRSKYDSKISSLFALICAKSKDKENERFMYLWMSINGMYNYMAKCAGKSTDNDLEKLKLILEKYDIGKSCLTRKTRKAIARRIISVISKNWDDKVISAESLSDSGSHRVIGNAIFSSLSSINSQDKITPYGYLLLELPYYFRCTYFHANKPVLLYAFEHELKCLRALNMIMESFLDRELYKYFSGEYNETYISDKLSKELSHV